MGGGGPQVDVDCVGVGGPLGVETLVGAETLRVKINISLPPPSPLTLAWLNSCSLTSVSDSLQSQVGVSLQLVNTHSNFLEQLNSCANSSPWKMRRKEEEELKESRLGCVLSWLIVPPVVITCQAEPASQAGK